jgi:hypothetical protein
LRVRNEAVIAADLAQAHRFRGDRVDRAGQAGVGDGPQVDIEQVIEADPGQPLLAGAPPGAVGASHHD